VKISIVYVSESGNTEKVAGFIRTGAEQVPETDVRLFNLAKPESVDEADADGEAEEGRKKRYPHQKAPKNLSTDQYLEKLKESDGASTAVPREHRRRRNRGPKPEEERGEEAIAEQAPEEA
jgi:hypothetical protein